MSGKNMRLRLLLLCLLLIGLLSACGRKKTPDQATVPEATLVSYLADLPEGWGLIQAAQVAESRPFLVDVREPGQYATGFIDGAVNIPLRELTQHLNALPGMDEEIVIVSDSSGLSALAMEALQILGYRNVKVLAGGMTAWRAAELPVVGAPVPELADGPTPDVDADLLAAVDAYLSETLPEDSGLARSRTVSQMLEQETPPFLLDVRQPEEFVRDHIEDSINIPLRELGQDLDQIPQDQPIVVICGSGHRSAIAMMALQLAGFEDVESLEGGLLALKVVRAATADVEKTLDSYLASLPQDWGLVSGEQALEGQPFLVDVREPDEYASGFIEGAVNIPIRELAQQLDALPGMGEKIVVICGSGTRSAIGMAALQLLGYQDVTSLAGGMRAWKAAGLPVVTEPVPKPATGAVPKVDAGLLAAIDKYLREALPQGWGVISADELVAIQNDLRILLPPAYVDVREPDEFDLGHIERTFNLPLRNLIRNLGMVPFEQPTSD
jgi:rhodanese-related sulfurtransferase